jgi:hypothetical protein
MPHQSTPFLADPRLDVRVATVGADDARETVAGHPAARRLRARLAVMRVRAPDTLRARIRRELRAAREAAGGGAAARA